MLNSLRNDSKSLISSLNLINCGFLVFKILINLKTMELSKLAQPGQTFYGVDKMMDGKIVIFGGGVPLINNGMIIGGLGISGGTGEEDHSLAEYALSVLPDIL